MKKGLLLFLVLNIIFSCTNKDAQTDPTTKKAKPNILLIVVDDLGYADFDPFSQSENSSITPHISRIAKAGTSYSNAYVTAPVCSPSRAGLITGKNQFRWDGQASWGPGLPDSVKTIAEYLQKAGYATARIGKNDLGQKFHQNDVREYPLHHGYDEFLGFCAHAHDYWLNSQEIKDKTPDPFGTSALLGPLMHNMGEKSYEEGYLTEIFSTEAINYIKQKRDKPFFLTLSYNAVHHLIHEVPQAYLDKYDVEPIANYNPDDSIGYGNHSAGTYSAYYDKYSRLGDIDQENMRKYYLANVNCLDDQIGRVLDVLKEQKLDEETVIIFLSDNGGSPLTGSNNAPLTAGKYSLWEGGIRVPMVIAWPGQIEDDVIDDRLVSATDILPTLASIGNFEITDSNIDGLDLLADKNLDAPANRTLVWKWQRNWAIRVGDWKLTNTKENHWKSDPSAQYIKPILDNDELKLFNVREDPGERNNRVIDFPEKVEALEKAYDKWCENNLGKY